MVRELSPRPLCARCAAHEVRKPGVTVCSYCRLNRECPICRQCPDDKAVGGWCRPCFEAVEMFKVAFESYGLNPAPLIELGARIDFYALRASRGEPLFRDLPSWLRAS